MSSAGQALGGLAGGIIGFFVGGPTGALYGAQLGMMAGGLIDPPKGPKIEGPRLNDLSVQTSGYGQMIPRIYGGGVGIYGNVFWVENNALREVKKTESQGGKGGNSSSVTSYAYYATFGVALCEGEIGGVRRIWASGKLIFDSEYSDVPGMIDRASAINPYSLINMVKATATGGVAAYLGDGSRFNFTVFNGSADQQPSSRMQASLGVANTPAYRNTAWILFEDVPMEDFGNSLMGLQIKVEVINKPMVPEWSLIGTYDIDTGSQYSTPMVIGTTQDPFDWSVLKNDANLSEIFNRRGYLGEIVSTDDLSYLLASNAIASGVWQHHDLGGVAPFQSDVVVLPNGLNITDVGDPPYASGVNLKMIAQRVSSIDGNAYYYIGGGNYGGTYYQKIAKYGLGGNRISYAGPNEDGWTFSPNGGNFGLKDGGSGNLLVNRYDDDLVYIDQTSIANCPCATQWPAWLDGDTLYALAVSDTSGPPFYATGRYLLTINLATQTWLFTRLPESVQGVIWEPQGIRYYPELEALSVWMYYNSSVYKVTQLIYANTYTATGETELLSEIVKAECLLSGLLSISDIDTDLLTSEVRGYRISSVASIRSAIEPLASAFPFDVIQNGYTIKFIPRPSSAVATIDYDELGAINGNEKAPRMTESREMDSQLPRKVTVKYIDVSREYDTSEQSAERLNTDAVNHLNADLSIVLTADEAAKVCESTLYRLWLERNDLSFVLPPTRSALQPADVVTIETPDADIEARLVTMNYLPDGRIECTAKHNAASIYSPNAVGSDGVYFGQTGLDIPITGPCLISLIDCPTLSDSTNKAGFIAAMTGYVDSWSGGNAWVSSDGGSTFDYYGQFRNAVTIGVTTNALGVGRTDIIDASNRVNLRLLLNSLSSVTIEQMLGGSGHYAIGADGRWEIIGAASAVQETDGSYTLSTLLRGRIGSEWAMSTHAAGDLVVWLNDPDLSFIESSINTITLPRTWRVASIGEDVTSALATDINFTYQAQNLECLPPKFFKAWKQAGTGTWIAEWTRQTRIGWAWRDNVDAALGENLEEYSIDLFSSDNYSSILATISVTSPSFSLTTAQQTSLLGGSPDSLFGDVYQVSPIAGRGQKLRFSAVMPDPYWANTSLALHFDGTSGTQSFIDEKGHTLSVSGSGCTLSSTYVKFGATSGKCTSNYIYCNDAAEFQMGAGDFTIDFWVYLTGTSGGTVIKKGTATTDFYLVINASTCTLNFACYNSGGTLQQFTTTAGIPQNQWVHVEFARSVTTAMAFINGVKDVTTATINNDIRITGGAILSVFGGTSISSLVNSYIDDLRITKGYARHTASFTPPTGPFLQG